MVAPDPSLGLASRVIHKVHSLSAAITSEARIQRPLINMAGQVEGARERHVKEGSIRWVHLKRPQGTMARLSLTTHLFLGFSFLQLGIFWSQCNWETPEHRKEETRWEAWQ